MSFWSIVQDVLPFQKKSSFVESVTHILRLFCNLSPPTIAPKQRLRRYTLDPAYPQSTPGTTAAILNNHKSIRLLENLPVGNPGHDKRAEDGLECSGH